MKDKSALKKMTIEELQAVLLSLRKEQFNLRMKKASGALDKPHFITRARRDIARVKTILTEKVGSQDV